MTALAQKQTSAMKVWIGLEHHQMVPCQIFRWMLYYINLKHFCDELNIILWPMLIVLTH